MKIERAETLDLYTGRCHAALKMKEQKKIHRQRKLKKTLQSNLIC